MNAPIPTFLCLLPLALSAACSEETTVAAKETTEDALDASWRAFGDTVGAAADGLADLDPDLLSPAALRGKALEVLEWSVTHLEEARDSEAAADLARGLAATLDQAEGWLAKVVAELPERAELKARVDALRERYADDVDVSHLLGPVLARFQALLD